MNVRRSDWRVVLAASIAGALVGLASGDWRFGVGTVLALLAVIYGVRN